MVRKTGRKVNWSIHDRGSALITTLVALLFLIVLGTVVLAASTMNMRTKAMNKQAKNDFYEDEQALTDIYNGIGQVSSECFGTAYNTILGQITATNVSKYATEEAAYEEFCRIFVNQLKSRYSTTDTTVLITELNKYATASGSFTVKATDGITIMYKNPGETDDSKKIPSQFIFENVTVLYKNPSVAGYESMITTDIVVNMPYVRFFDDHDEMLDYSLVSNKGIYFENATSSGRVVQGNVYAGTNTDRGLEQYREKDVYGGINLYHTNVTFMSKYLVSKGDFNIRQSTLQVDNGGSQKSNVWVESLRTTGGAGAAEFAGININGQVFVANDFEINSENTNVTLNGGYYGYNNNVYVTKESEKIGGSLSHTSSSAILVNQKNATINFANLSTMIIAGKAYMDFGTSEQATGESLALKSNQVMYLVPSTLLKHENPLSQAQAASLYHLDAGGNITDTITLPYMWFTPYLTAENVRTKKYTVTNGGVTSTYYFFYLDFIDGGAETYAREIMHATEPTDPSNADAVWKWNMKNKLQERLFNAVLGEGFINNVTAPTTATNTKVYGKGELISVSGNTLGTVDNLNMTVEQVTLMGDSLIKRYKWLFWYLNSQEALPLTYTATTFPTPTTTGYSETLLPLDSIVDMSKLSFKSVENPATYVCGYKTVVHNGTTLDVTSDFKGVILCSGNVVIYPGVDVEGLVLAGGTITIQGDGSIVSNRSIVQMLLDEEIKKENAKDPSDTSYNPDFVTCYLRNYTGEHKGETSNSVVTGTDYVDYIVYDNWTKGDSN